MEIIEHVRDPREFIHAAAALVRPGGLLFVATINRTLKSLALAKIAAEYILGWLAPGTHDWNRFIAPATLRDLMKGAGLDILRTQGVTFDPLLWTWGLSDSTDVNYLVVGRRQG
jgi:2-polyprenyl-6-hydroxyphenyl methylase/3-demethylubiquinone-9 3-methyltransferase